MTTFSKAMATWGLVLLAVIFAGYFLPAIIAHRRGHRNAIAIFVLNLSLGWTVIGWIAAVVWAFTDEGAADSAPAGS
jgi:hypothetical protein